MSFYQVKFEGNYLSLFDNGEIEFTSERKIKSNIQDIQKLDLHISPIQYNKTNKKVLIRSKDYKVVDLEANPISAQTLYIENQLINIFWSQIEENIVIASYDNRIDLIDTNTDSQNYQIVQSVQINNLTQCRNFQSHSILRQFSLIALIENEKLYLITPFVTSHFTLSEFAFEKLKNELPNIKKYYFDECFVRKNEQPSEQENEQPLDEQSEKVGFYYEFNSLYGIDIEPIFYPLDLNVNDQNNIVDFSVKGDDIYLLFKDDLIMRVSIPATPSLFDRQQIVKIDCCKLAKIQLTHFISSGSYLFGISENENIQFFNECFISNKSNKQIINIINLRKISGKKKMLGLLYSDGTYEEIEDLSIYYESCLSERFKTLQQRKQEILKKNRDIRLKYNQFKKEISKLVSLKQIESLAQRVEKLNGIFIQTNENKDIKIEKIKSEIPSLKENAQSIYNSHSKRLNEQKNTIENMYQSTNQLKMNNHSTPASGNGNPEIKRLSLKT